MISLHIFHLFMDVLHILQDKLLMFGNGQGFYTGTYI